MAHGGGSDKGVSNVVLRANPEYTTTREIIKEQGTPPKERKTSLKQTINRLALALFNYPRQKVADSKVWSWREGDVGRTAGASRCHTRTSVEGCFKPLDA